MDAPYLKVSEDVKLGKNVKLAGFCNLYGCEIGDFSSIGPFVEIQKGARIGASVKVQSHTFICAGVEIEDEVFVGHGVMFINDRFPRSTREDGGPKREKDWVCEPTWVKRKASIGSNVTVLCGVTIGEEAVVGAGSVVTKDVPARAVAAGNPAKILRFLDKSCKNE